MRDRSIGGLTALVCLVLLTPALAEDFRTSIRPELPSKQEGRTTYYTLASLPPSEAEILRACPERDKLGKEIRVFCELIEYRLEQPRFYPLAGWARLSQARFKCLIQGNLGQAEVFINRDELVMVQ